MFHMPYSATEWARTDEPAISFFIDSAVQSKPAAAGEAVVCFFLHKKEDQQSHKLLASER